MPFRRGGGVVDTRSTPGEFGAIGASIGEALGGLVSRLDPDHALRRYVFRATDQERQHRASMAAFSPEDRGRLEAMLLEHQGTHDIADLQLRTQEAKNELAVIEELSEILSPHEIAVVRRAAILSEGADSERALRLAQRDLQILEIAERLGLTAEALANQEVLSQSVDMLELRLQSRGLELDAQAMTDFTEMYLNASERDKEIMTTGLMGPRGTLFGQSLLQQRQFDHEIYMLGLRQAMEAGATQREIDEHDFQMRTEIRRERDRVRAELREALEEGGSRRDEIPGYVNDLRILAQDMMRIDPREAVTIAQETRGWLRRNRVTGVEFSMTDITESLSDDIVADAYLLAGIEAPGAVGPAGMSNEMITQLREEYTDPRTGRVNERMVQAIITLAGELLENEEQMQADALAQARLAARGGIARGPLGQEILELERRAEAMLEAQEGPMPSSEFIELMAELRWRKLLNWLARVPGEERPASTGRGEVRPGPR